MKVVFPAPFGPSRPVMPWPMSTSRPSTATVDRYRFVTPRAETTGAVAVSLMRRTVAEGRRVSAMVS